MITELDMLGALHTLARAEAFHRLFLDDMGWPDDHVTRRLMGGMLAYRPWLVASAMEGRADATCEQIQKLAEEVARNGHAY